MFRLYKPLGTLLCGLACITACKVNKNNTSSNPSANNPASASSARPVKKPPYHATETLTLDVIHMDLAVAFDYTRQQVMGQAVLLCKPYFYDLKTAELDARAFTIKRVGMITVDDDTLSLKYEYNGAKLLVFLDRTYTRKEEFSLFIDYVANPEEVKSKRGNAITDNKGLYFINPTGKDQKKPRQIWTQGETQSNSCWFPTVDLPNEKITHSIAVTVENKDITLSNGELMMSKERDNGMRTDFWEQTKPHAPYLVMLAAGEFAKVKDYWRDSVAVDYYVEPEYRQYARMVFGNTPEMMEVFSQKLGVDYPWSKFSQIVVRDFVSGAMENTSAVVHYDALQHDAREHLDNPHEDIVAHELFHHWFGDLVTCESWSNLPLNESFATYGEYIWQEHKYGAMEADQEFHNNLRAYLGQKNKHKVDPVRYHYYSRDELFDVVSYQKGGCILHLLRRQVGDEAFFEALKHYLTSRAYKTAEMADLRMAFEEVTGQDLNWFFNQWFLQPGHPVLEYTYAYSPDRTSVKVTITQKQDSAWGVYRLPLKADVYSNGKVTREELLVNSREQSFDLNSPGGAVDFVNIDADKTLPAAIEDNKSVAEFRAMIKNGPLYMDKYYGVKGWISTMGDSPADSDLQTFDYLLSNEFWGVRNLGLTALEKLDSTQLNRFVSVLSDMALHDAKAANRADAVLLLAGHAPGRYTGVFEQTVNDSAYSVVAASLQALWETDIALARPHINQNKTIKNKTLQYTIASLLAEDATTDEVDYFESTFDEYGYYNFAIMSAYVKYLQLASPSIQEKAITGLKRYYATTSNENIKIVMPSWVKNLQGPWKDALADLKEQKGKVKAGSPEAAEVDRKIARAEAMISGYETILNK